MTRLRFRLLFFVTLLLAAAASFANVTTVRFSVWDGDKALETIRQLVADFESQNPDIKVKLEN